MVATNIPIFDGGAFLLMIIIGFTCLAFYKKIGAVMIAFSCVFFLICGLVVATGEDVILFHQQNPTISTVTVKNGTGAVVSTTTTVITIPQNDTNYIIGNGQFPITGTVQMVFGWSLLALAVVLGVIFLDAAWKGNLVRGD